MADTKDNLGPEIRNKLIKINENIYACNNEISTFRESKATPLQDRFKTDSPIEYYRNQKAS